MPTAAKIARGETRPSRINRAEPLPRRGQPRMPADMTDRAKTVWRHMLDAAPPDLVTPYDSFLLRAFCEAVDLYTVAVKLLAASSPMIKGVRSGDLIRNPLHLVVRDHREAIRLLGRELGASPAMRASLVVGAGSGFIDDADIGPPPRLRMVAGAG